MPKKLLQSPADAAIQDSSINPNQFVFLGLDKAMDRASRRFSVEKDRSHIQGGSLAMTPTFHVVCTLPKRSSGMALSSESSSCDASTRIKAESTHLHPPGGTQGEGAQVQHGRAADPQQQDHMVHSSAEPTAWLMVWCRRIWRRSWSLILRRLHSGGDNTTPHPGKDGSLPPAARVATTQARMNLESFFLLLILPTFWN